MRACLLYHEKRYPLCSLHDIRVSWVLGVSMLLYDDVFYAPAMALRMGLGWVL